MRYVLLIAFVLALFATTEVPTSAHTETELCQALKAEAREWGYTSRAEVEFFLNWAGCDSDTMTRNSGMCNRYASRLANSYLHKFGEVYPYYEELAARVEAQSSNGHDCEQYEDGAYGFPSKQIDCSRDTRC